jgi:3,4-dihydroxy 2-butanone 4-phosphate synthase/GTP cyclohydrolase II
MTGERLDALRLPPMVATNTASHGTAFTVSVDYRPGTTTGVSATDRAATVRALADPNAAAEDFCRPGHVFPLRSRPGGVLDRAGHTEASVDLVRLAGLQPAAAICELTRTDGAMARLADARRFADTYDLPVITIAQLRHCDRREERLVSKVGPARLPTRHGVFEAYAFRSTTTEFEHLALVLGDMAEGMAAPLVRVHSECLTGDAFGSLRCDCGAQLEQALANIAEAGRGVVLYLRGHEGRGIGLARKIDAYSLQEQGFDTVEANVRLGLPADARQYGIAAQMLRELGVRRVQLLTNNHAKADDLERFGLVIERLVPVLTPPTDDNVQYLQTKQLRFGHDLRLDQLANAARFDPGAV